MRSLPSAPPRPSLQPPRKSAPRVGWVLVLKSASDRHLVLVIRTAGHSSGPGDSGEEASFAGMKLKLDFKAVTVSKRGKPSFFGSARITLANSPLFSVTLNPAKSRWLSAQLICHGQWCSGRPGAGVTGAEPRTGEPAFLSLSLCHPCTRAGVQVRWASSLRTGASTWRSPAHGATWPWSVTPARSATTPS